MESWLSSAICASRRTWISTVDVWHDAFAGSEAHPIPADIRRLGDGHDERRSCAGRQGWNVDGRPPVSDKSTLAIEQIDDGRELLNVCALRRVSHHPTNGDPVALAGVIESDELQGYRLGGRAAVYESAPPRALQSTALPGLSRRPAPATWRRRSCPPRARPPGAIPIGRALRRETSRRLEVERGRNAAQGCRSRSTGEPPDGCVRVPLGRRRPPVRGRSPCREGRPRAPRRAPPSAGVRRAPSATRRFPVRPPPRPKPPLSR